MTGLTGHYQILVKRIVRNPESRLSEWPLLTEADRQRVLVEWNDTRTDYPREKTIHQLFEEQVERTPNAVAVIHEDERWTYRELNCTANELAHYLQKLGVGPEILVDI